MDYQATGDDFKLNAQGELTGKCKFIDPTGEQYKNGRIMNHTDGMCGFKYQVTNSNKFATTGGVPFKVLKDGAATILATSAVAIAAVLAF